MTLRTSADHRQRAGRTTLLSAAAGLGLTFTAAVAPAWAHDSLIGSSPEADAVLEESPEEIALEFSGAGLTAGESITNLIAVSDEAGEGWAGDTEVEGSTMTADLPEELPGGDYTVTYRVVYSDGHAEESSFGFEVAETDAEPEQAPASSSPAGEEADSAVPQQDDDAEQSAPAEAESAAAQDSGLPAWGVAVGAVIVLGALAAVVVAVLRGRARRRN